MLEERSMCSLTSGQLGFQCSLSLHGSCIDSSQVCSASPGSTGCSLVFFLTYEKEGKKETVRVYFAFTSECLACGDEPVVSDRTLSVVSVLHFYFPTIELTQSIKMVRGRIVQQCCWLTSTCRSGAGFSLLIAKETKSLVLVHPGA